MINSKNQTPHQIAFFTSLVVAGICALLVFFVKEKWYVALVAGVLVLIVSYALYYYSLNRFIYRKIKLIYKLIYNTKATKKEEFYNEEVLPQKSVDEVHDEVQVWAIEKTKEIDLLKTNDQFRKEFLMNLTHELRTPIFTVQGYIDTLLNGAIEDKEVRHRFLANAAKSIDRLALLVDDIDKISKIESGQIPLHFERFNIQQLVKEVYQEFYLVAKNKGYHLLFKKDIDAATMVNADREQIRQVLVNLISNALKYGKPKGTVECGVYHLDEKKVLIEITDDGIGIAEENIARIFERFYRTDKSRSSKVGGTGLGLSIVKHIIEAHGQTVTLRSKPGVGTSFAFTLQQGGG